MKKIYATFVLFCSILNAQAQMAVLKKELPRPSQLTYYAINHLGDTSSIVSNEIAKETPLRTYTFKEPFLGAVFQYDERNPLQQLVFYRNTQQLVILDNQLSEKERWVLSEKFPQLDASFAAFTAQSTIWIFDEASKRWCIISGSQEQPMFVSNPITDADFITTYGNYAYWQIGTKVYGIDIYGKLLKEQSLPEKAKLLAINGHKMLYQLNNNVFLFDTELNETETLKEVAQKVTKALFNGRNISVLTEEKLFLYNVN